MKHVICRKNNCKLEFYLIYDSKEYYLFTQSYKSGVERFYKSGVTLDRAINHGIGKKDFSIHKTIDKLKIYIKYIEKESNITVLKKSQKRTREQTNMVA